MDKLMFWLFLGTFFLNPQNIDFFKSFNVWSRVSESRVIRFQGDSLSIISRKKINSVGGDV